ncbi:hypothetical protein JCM12178A_11410 [Salidesulfovibrio brasiliensis]
MLMDAHPRVSQGLKCSRLQQGEPFPTCFRRAQAEPYDKHLCEEWSAIQYAFGKFALAAVIVDRHEAARGLM